MRADCHPPDGAPRAAERRRAPATRKKAIPKDDHFPVLLKTAAPARSEGTPDPDAPVIPLSAGSMLSPDQVAALIRHLGHPDELAALPQKMSHALAMRVASTAAMALNLPYGPRPKRLGRSRKPVRAQTRKRGKSEDPMVYTRAGDKRVSTGFRKSQEKQAKAVVALLRMIEDAKNLGAVLPTQVRVVIPIVLWLSTRRPSGETTESQVKSYNMEGHFARRLIEGLGDLRLVDLTPERQDAYVAWRMTLPGRGTRDGTPLTASDQTARNEMEFLDKALRFWKSQANVAWIPNIKKPKRNPPRVAWLLRGEAARALLGARGWLWDVEKGAWKTTLVWDPEGREWYFDAGKQRWRIHRLGHGAFVERPLLKRDPYGYVCRKPAVGRALTIAFYTGTRAEAIQLLRWKRNGVHGYFELTREPDDNGGVQVCGGTLFRSDHGWSKTSKGQGPCAMARRLAQHVDRWERRNLAAGIKYVVHHRGNRQYSRQIDAPIRWAMLNAGMHPMPVSEDDLRFVDQKGKLIDVTLHVYRHTCATMLLEMGVSPESVANFLDITLEVLFRTYGHRTLGGTKDPAAALDLARQKVYRDRFS